MKYFVCKGNLLNFTNNRTESLNKWLKDMVKKFQTLIAFIVKFFQWYESHEKQIVLKSSINFIKVPVSAKTSSADIEEYQRCLTDFAFKRILFSQITAEISYEIVIVNRPSYSCTIASTEGTLEVTDKFCTCSHFASSLLPCRHVFAVRKAFKLPLFDKSLVNERWTKAYELRTLQERRQENPL